MRNHTETAQIIQLFAVRPKLGKKVRDPHQYLRLNARKAYPTPREIFVFGKTAITTGEKPPPS